MKSILMVLIASMFSWLGIFFWNEDDYPNSFVFFCSALSDRSMVEVCFSIVDKVETIKKINFDINNSSQ